MWPIITFYIIFLFLIVSGRQKFHLFLWPTIALMTHFQTALAVFLFMATILYFAVFKWNFNIKRYILFGILVSSIFLLPQVIFDLRHDFLMSRSLVSQIKGEDRGLSVSKKEKKKLITIHKDPFIINYNSGFLSHGYSPDFPLLVALASFLVFFLRRKDFRKEEVLFIKTTLTIPLLVFLATVFYPFPLRYWFLTGFEMFYILPISLILSKLLNFGFGKILAAVFIASILPLILGRINDSYFKNPDDKSFSKIKGIKKAIDYIYQDGKGEKFGLLVFAPPVYTPNYDYVVFWYGRNKYGYTPHSEKKGTFYLLMEPDPHKKHSYKGWLETVIITGKTIKQEKLPSGLIVEKRQAE